MAGPNLLQFPPLSMVANSKYGGAGRTGQKVQTIIGDTRIEIQAILNVRLVDAGTATAVNLD